MMVEESALKLWLTYGYPKGLSRQEMFRGVLSLPACLATLDFCGGLPFIY